jgi:tetratricopeptide (TPR) repeat protein
MASLRLNRLDEAEKCAREALLRNPNLAQAYLVLSDAYGRQHEYLAQLQGLEAYLKLEPNGADSQSARRAHQLVQGILAKGHPEE